MKCIATKAYFTGARALICLSVLILGGCTALQPKPRATVYDFGPGPVATVASTRMAPLPTLVLADTEASAALDSTAVLYRLAYSDAQQLRPYALARWSMTPAQLLRQRLREQLGQRRAVLNAAQGVVADKPAMVLHLELDEFSQLFETAQQSSGLVRLRATLGQGGQGSQRLVAQRSFIVQRPAASADAEGGVRALAAATDAVIAEIAQWLQQVEGAGGMP
ncbi:membrane integrity-associated transporter subunit PqiC [Rhodoferax sp. AJA081-3]|nr:ABC-type transport auxiliary lipoprotein family protein [Rhodoferax sp. AJA081-3]QTN26333.1 membrane integrity-associated transporter subunit PqiC [Rhodoferax sp. AJA081-3]